MKLIDIINDIAEGKIKEKEIKLGYGAGYYTYYVEEDKIINDTNGTGLYINKCLNDEFEILETIEQDIDIQSIKEYKTNYLEGPIDKEIRKYINKSILPAIKQLDRKIREER